MVKVYHLKDIEYHQFLALMLNTIVEARMMKCKVLLLSAHDFILDASFEAFLPILQ